MRGVGPAVKRKAGRHIAVAIAETRNVRTNALHLGISCLRNGGGGGTPCTFRNRSSSLPR
jgi:hypothetical protein